MRPLERIKVIEMEGTPQIPPTNYCGMLLSDFGADVMVIERLSKRDSEIPHSMSKNLFNRGKRSMRIDLKTKEGLEILQGMIKDFDVFMESFRPGVMEALSLGPKDALKLNPRLIYARLTGWGQTGPYAHRAGHDINFIALSGALSLFRRKGERPLPPCNIVGDFAGGSMFCVFGILLALIERSKSGKGQVIDVAMVDGTANLLTQFYASLANHLMTLDIGTNLIDGGAPFYQVYETSDGKFVAVGAIERKFYGQLIEGIGLDPSSLPHQYDMSRWPEMKDHFTKAFKTKTRDEWVAFFEGKDACVFPVLELNEVEKHPHNQERELIINMDGIPQPAPAPKLSRTPGKAVKSEDSKGSCTRDILNQLGYAEEKIKSLFEKGIVE